MELPSIIAANGQRLTTKESFSARFAGVSMKAERIRYGFVGIHTVALKPSNTLFPHCDSQNAPICANGSANVEIPLQWVSVFTSSNGVG